MHATSPGDRLASPRSRRLIAVLLLVAAALVYVARVGGPGGPTGTEGVAIGQLLPYFELEPLTGDARGVSLADLQGRVTLINYWGTWCGPCRLEFPELLELAARFASFADFRLYAVSCGSAGSDSQLDELSVATREFLAQQKSDQPTYADRHAGSRRALVGVMGVGPNEFAYPTTLVVDRAGRIRGLWQGYDQRGTRSMAQLIEQLLEESPQRPAKTP